MLVSKWVLSVLMLCISLTGAPPFAAGFLETQCLHKTPAGIPSLSHMLMDATGPARETELPIFDAHIHYNSDVWEVVPPKEAITRLRKAGIVRALVSSSS